MRTAPHPTFAVVGHPNKGKSSIVSALAMDDSIAISDTPGTTTKKRSFPLKVDGEILYELFDTPGFQRARQVLAWLKQHDVSADRRHEVVEMFINTYKEDEKFHDEIELLEPIMAGAGIIYVVDASKPYGEEYEAEMEILRWTGQPSMALINHIEDEDYSEEWKRALGGYFQIIRTFNPMEKEFEQHISILESMAQLREEWMPQIKRSIERFKAYHEQMIERSATAISKLLYRALSYVEEYPLQENDEASERDKEEIARRYKDALRSFESEAQHRIEQIWNHRHLRKEEEHLAFEGMDLFSEESASVFGLTRKELLITAATSGAAAGAGVDLMLGGSSFLLGTGIGAVVGGIGALFAFNELSEIKVLGQKLGRRYLEMGPMENRNFPYILLGRMLYHTLKMATLSHAYRGAVDLKMDQSFKERWLDEKRRKSLEKFHTLFRSGKAVDEEKLSEYEALVADILHRLIDAKEG
jgi:GTPase Era involved in 16S rRNA processing